MASDAQNARLEIGPWDTAGRSSQVQLNSTGGTVTFTGGTLRLGGLAANLLRSNYGCTNVAVNDPLAAVETAGGPVK